MDKQYINGLKKALELVEEWESLKSQGDEKAFKLIRKEIDKLEAVNNTAIQLHEIYKLGSGSKIQFNCLDIAHRNGVLKQAEWLNSNFVKKVEG